MNLFLKVLIIVVLSAIAAFAAGNIILSKTFSRDAEVLFNSSVKINDKKFDLKQLVGLPEPVQRYFRYALKPGQPYISYVRLKHNGLFKTDLNKDYIRIDGEQYYTTGTPGFLWKGRTSMFTACDMYINKKGALIVHLLSLFKIVNGHGEIFNHSELLRWLGESVWFPTNLLPDKNLKWSPIDKNRARLDFTYDGMNLFYIVDFNMKGEIIKLETKRYMAEGRLETWIGRCSEYIDSSGMMIPSMIEAAWYVDGREQSYGKFKIQEIQYDIPEEYRR